jgi:hypothetical protein
MLKIAPVRPEREVMQQAQMDLQKLREPNVFGLILPGELNQNIQSPQLAPLFHKIKKRMSLMKCIKVASQKPAKPQTLSSIQPL